MLTSMRNLRAIAVARCRHICTPKLTSTPLSVLDSETARSLLESHSSTWAPFTVVDIGITSLYHSRDVLATVGSTPAFRRRYYLKKMLMTRFCVTSRATSGGRKCWIDCVLFELLFFLMCHIMKYSILSRSKKFCRLFLFSCSTKSNSISRAGWPSVRWTITASASRKALSHSGHSASPPHI
jgi:hypothetical protein